MERGSRVFAARCGELFRVFLKRVVLHGFKSFADRTEFEFDRGRTSIVGPNGCGKSNVLDAIRWVLGEQSARTLRGKQMLDVVFAGSRSRKPANFSEVSLTFDNGQRFFDLDDAEVTVTRTLFRSGDSEYRINSKKCRLRDIRDLLLDTGVGVDAYSVIEQGRVDAVLQASPQQRRELFEEAAGVSRYKVRRAEAQRKLERTQQNLLRVHDVVDELERRLRSVKLAAGKARNFQEYDARLRELRSSFSLAEFHEIEQRRTALEHQTRVYNDLLAAKGVELARRDADEAEHAHELQARDEQISQLEQALAEVKAEASAVLERIEQSARRLNELQAQRARQSSQAGEAARRASELEDQITHEAHQLAEFESAEQVAAEEVAELEAAGATLKAELNELRDKLRTARNAAYELSRDAARLNNQLENLRAHEGRLARQQEELAQRKAEVAQRHETLAGRGTTLEEQAHAVAQRIATNQAQLRECDGELEGFAARLAEFDAEAGEKKEARSGVLSRMTLLRDMEQRHEGVHDGTQWVLEWLEDVNPERRHLDAGTALGCVADLIQIDDPRVYALQPVLATFETDIVVERGERFLGALDAREDRPDSLRFWALDQLPAAAAATAVPRGVLACALDWVRCDDAVRGLARHLLGDVFVVEDRAAALAAAARAPAGSVFCALSGEVVHGSGRIETGSAQLRPGLISRKAEIRQLQAEIDAIETALEQLARQRNVVREAQSDTNVRREACLTEIARAQQDEAQLRTERARLNDEVERSERESQHLARELEELARQSGQHTRELEETAARLGAAQESQAAHETQVAEREAEVAAREHALAERGAKITAAQVAAGRAAERRSACASALERLTQQRSVQQQAHAAADREAAEAAQRIADAERELHVAEQRATELAALERDREGAVFAAREARQGIRRQLEAAVAARKLLQADRDGIEAALHDAEIALREHEVRKENLTTRIREELDLDLPALYETYAHTDQDWGAIKAEIEELRTKIERLGNVNLDSIQELEELTPRYDNLISQRDDLLASVGRLENLIGELDEESRTRFLACFEEVRGNFRELFRKLFGGGKADIILEDPEQPLECGLEIIARPPGKEPRSISLLSGGEKTMTAVALLFAVFKRKPSPFAILDEVDAALDEANINRFNSMLDDFLEHSQFILITHSKQTMQCADVLYGVTMEEPGVSKRVAVRFDNRLEAPHVA